MAELAGIANGDGAGEAVGEFNLVELALDGLPQAQVIDIAQDEQRFDDLAEGFQGLIERMLSGIGIQPPEDVGRGVLLELDGGNEAQQRIPVLADQGLIDGFVRGDDPIMIPRPVLLEDVAGPAGGS